MDISDLEARVSAALDRIGAGLETIQSKPDPDATAALEQALADEKAASAQLDERLKAVREKTSSTILQLEQKAERMQDRLEAAEADLQRLRIATQMLQENSEKLREKNAENVGDAHLVNVALMSEIEVLRAARAADVAEMDAILAEMKPLVEEA